MSSSIFRWASMLKGSSLSFWICSRRSRSASCWARCLMVNASLQEVESLTAAASAGSCERRPASWRGSLKSCWRSASGSGPPAGRAAPLLVLGCWGFAGRRACRITTANISPSLIPASSSVCVSLASVWPFRKMPCDAAGWPVSASMKPLRSLMDRPGGTSRVSRSLSNWVPDEVMDTVTRGLIQSQWVVSSPRWLVAQKRFRRALTWSAEMGVRVPFGYAGASERRQEGVVLCAERCGRRGAGWTVDGGVVSGIRARRRRVQEGQRVRPGGSLYGSTPLLGTLAVKASARPWPLVPAGRR